MKRVEIGAVSLTQTDNGIRVEQNGHCVVIRKQKLNDAFRNAVQLFFDHGFIYLFQVHPVSGLPQSAILRRDGNAATHHALSFTKRPTQRWIFVIDGQSGEDVQYVILNKAYEPLLTKAGLDPEREKRNTNNFRVRFVDLPPLLNVMSDEAIAAIDATLIKQGKSRKPALSAIA